MDFFKENMNLNILRRFGAEIEINAFDGRNRPSSSSESNLPDGIYAVSNIVHEATGKTVKIHKWAYDHNNMAWIIKPDSSCGIEICSPVLKGWLGVMEIARVVKALGEDARVLADDRCSFHVHIDISDLSEKEVATIITWWVKCEPVFIDSVPFTRKRNQYCQLLAQSEGFERVEDDFIPNESLIRKLGFCKYFTINTYHYYNNKRKTIEFRIMDGECCVNPVMSKNWIRLLLHFVETSLRVGMPDSYRPNDRWSGYCWLDPRDVFAFLSFDSPNLSEGMRQICDWFLCRLEENCKDALDDGVTGFRARHPAMLQIEQMAHDFGLRRESAEHLFKERYRI